MPFTPEAKSILATVAALNDYKQRQQPTVVVPGGEQQQQQPRPDDGEDDEIPNEPKG